GARLGAFVLGPELGAFAGALTLGVATNAYARVLRRPEIVPMVPGMLLLVPGSLGFRSLSSLVEGQTVPGVEAAFRMTLVAVALATGLLFANVVLPARTNKR
ncbi:MAG TPA: threonine/serine exporter family protein, partial [Vicinamibacteria bacterium]|nr:threonine/serine exporter family protein [Vicinamibacteria bacterium]